MDENEWQTGEEQPKPDPDKTRDRPALSRDAPEAPHGAFGEGVDLGDVAEGVERIERTEHPRGRGSREV